MEQMTSGERIIILVGPTASGKTDLAATLAERIGGEIVNADSMQVYRRMDIGTAKPPPGLRRLVPHHLLDAVEPDEPFTAADFVREARRAIADIHGRGKRAIVSGGTGLYVKALTRGLAESPGGNETIREELKSQAEVEGNEALHRMLGLVDPQTARRLHSNDQLRVIRALEVYRITGRPLSALHGEHRFAVNRYACLKIGLAPDRTELYSNIDKRVEWMIGNGLVEEVKCLLSAGYGPPLKPMRSLGYRQICSFLAGECSLDEAIEFIKRDTRRYAKRQLTWFKQDREIKWIEYPVNVGMIVENANDFFY